MLAVLTGDGPLSRLTKRIRSLSRSRRADSPSRSEDERPESIRKPSQGSVSSRLSTANTLVATRAAGEIALKDSLGLSVLYAPKSEPVVDLIFVHGLGGASIKTWCKNHDRNLCWPKYWVPGDLGNDNVRVLTFGYNAEVLSKTKTKANISDFAKSLLAAMKFEKDAEMEDLGIGKAYLRGRNNSEHKDIISKVRAVLFLSTPHRGSNLADTLNKILSVSLTSYSRKAYITELAKNSSTIEDLNEDFRHQVSDLDVYSFYELRSTPLIGSQSAMIVAKDSSHLGFPQEESIPLDADHHDVCKYLSREDANYRSVISVLKTVTSKYVEEVEHDKAAKVAQSTRKIEKLLLIDNNPQEDYSVLRDRWAPGTCSGILQNDTFTSWIDRSESAGILWMHAGPGTGKSIKSSFMISHLQAAGLSCQYYFFKYGDIRKRAASALFRSLAFQISQDMPPFRQALTDLANEGSHNQRTEARQLWKILFESTLFSLSFERPLYWVIDAVDESDSISTIISSFQTIPRTLPIRIVIISRHLPSISTAFSRVSNSMPVKSLSIADNQDDIKYFIKKEVAYLPGDSDFHSEVTAQLMQRSEGNFLWVHLALQELHEIHSQEDLGRVLDQIPSGMDSMYHRMEKAINQLTKASDQLLSKMLLTWVTYGKRPLHLDELAHVLKPQFPSLLNLRSSIDQVCGHFVTVDNCDRVSLIHATARDYLRHTSELQFIMEHRSAHGALFDTSMQTLLDPQMRSRLGQRRLPPFCEYASTSWAYHLARTSADAPNVLAALVKFFKGPHVLPWIEMLAISRQLSSLVYASTALTSFIQHRRKSDAEKSPLLHRVSDLKLLELWALDLLKVTAKFGEYLLQDSSVIYKLVPQLCPLNSAIHQQFGTSSLAQISVAGLNITDWDDLSSRLWVASSHNASFIRCSGQYLAISTSADTIKIWNTISFQEILVLNHKEHIVKICMSGAGDRLVSYGSGTVKVWSLPVGFEILCVPNPRNVKPISLTLMDENKSLLMCTENREFRKLSLLNPGEGWKKVFPKVFKEEIAVKDSFTNTPTSLSFNNDVSQVAVAYRGAPLEVWDLASGEIVSRCKRVSRPSLRQKQTWTGVIRAIWHPFEYEVLGLYTDGTVFKWQPLTEAHTELPDAPDSSPSDIQIAPNGGTFLTSDVNGAIKIHSFQDFITIYRLSSEDVVTGMCFSPDSQRFYDIRGSYCNVWEPNALIRSAEPNDQDSDCESDVRSMSSMSLIASEASIDSSVSIISLAANPNGILVCTGDEEGNVTLHDINNDSKLQIAQSPIGMGIERMVWSDDGNDLAYEDLGRRLVVWSIVNQKASHSDSPWKAERVLETKLNLDGGITRGLFTRSDPSMLLAVGQSDALSYNLQSSNAPSSFDIPSSTAFWLNSPQDPTQLLAFDRETVSAFNWAVTGLEKVQEWKLDSHPLGSPSTETIRHATLSSDGDYILFVDDHQYTRQQSSTSLNISIIQTSSLSPSTKSITPAQLPQYIADLVETPLTILSPDLFVFISTSLWICSWRFDFKSLLGAHPSDDAEPEPPRSATTIKASPKLSRTRSEALMEMGVTRHFFLPGDWVTKDSLALCRVLSDGTFLCPRKGEVAVIRSGLGSEW
ncbi:hypothetical protein ACLMJK_007808 [Lecanora helva]